MKEARRESKARSTSDRADRSDTSVKRIETAREGQRERGQVKKSSLSQLSVDALFLSHSMTALMQ